MALSIQKLILIAAVVSATAATAQEPIQLLEPGIGYSRLKKWAIDLKLVFENYGKDTMVIRNTGVDYYPDLFTIAHFCAGDDYSGKANNIIIQENFMNRTSTGGSSNEGAREALKKERRYIELLAGAPQDEKFKGNYSIRPERKDLTNPGLSIQGEFEKGRWESNRSPPPFQVGSMGAGSMEVWTPLRAFATASVMSAHGSSFRRRHVSTTLRMAA